MNADSILAAEETVALTVGVARDVIGQGDNRGLPRPRFIVGTLAFYAILSLLAAFGENAARFAAAAGGVAALTIVVSKPGAEAVTGLLDRLTSLTASTKGAKGAAPSPVGVTIQPISPSSPVYGKG